MALPSLIEDTPVYYYDGTRQHGPMPCRDLWTMAREGKMASPAYFWSSGMAEWLPVEQLPPPPESLAKRPIVLVIDDDILMCEMVSELIRSHRIDVVTATDLDPARQKLEELGTGHFDAVITDYEMPGGTGVELVRWIKQRERALQVLMLTAQDNKEIIKLGLRSGISDFLEKPVRKAALLNALDTAINLTTQQREEKAALMELVRQRLVGKGLLAEQVMQGLVNREAGLSNLLAKLDIVRRYADQLERQNPEVFPGSEVYSPQQAPFAGILGELSVLDILQMLIQSHKTGELELVTPSQDRMGAIYLDHGNIVHAVAGSTESNLALKRLIQQSQGSFRFSYGIIAPRYSINGSSMTVLLNISSELDMASSLAAA